MSLVLHGCCNLRGMETQTGTNMTDDRSRHREGRVARAIEQQTARLPSDVFLWAAGAAMAGSLVTQIFGIGGRRNRMMSERAPLSTFIGQWVPTLLLFGVYNKIVKVQGSDRTMR